MAGERQAEMNEAVERGYYLWAWHNPRPEQSLAALTEYVVKRTF